MFDNINFYIRFTSYLVINKTKNNIMTTLNNSELLNKSCEIELNGKLYFCYNVTSLMHFVKCGKKNQILKPNKNNSLNIKKDLLIKLINTGVAKITVGAL